jgi:gamma-glutamyltranspeptidase / glutathione hydrolase
VSQSAMRAGDHELRLHSGDNRQFRFAMGRPPAVATHAMVVTSNPNATRAGLRQLERGGNAVDAAVAAAAMLCVAEPMNTGIGGDACALVSSQGAFFALDSMGPAPRDADPVAPVQHRGPHSVTVPGAVAGWAELSSRFGRRGLDTCLADAIDAAENGLAVCARSAALWADEIPCPAGVAPPTVAVGEIVSMPEMAQTLRRIAEQGPSAVYTGQVARAITEASWLSMEDLAIFRPRWTTPLRAVYRGFTVLELPPPTQGVAALEALLLLEGLEPTLANQVRCVQLALDDAQRRVRDGADVTPLLDPDHIRARRYETAQPVGPVSGGTSHVCAIDGDGLGVSLIESLFNSYGSGVVADGTGVALQNRGACFAIEGSVAPGRRPFHTIIPAMLAADDQLVAAFGVVGGQLQAQAHVQLVSALVDDRLDPQAALDRPRFRVAGDTVRLEEGLWPEAASLEKAGHTTVPSSDWTEFGSGQLAAVYGDALLGASDPRMDGYAGGL